MASFELSDRTNTNTNDVHVRLVREQERKPLLSHYKNWILLFVFLAAVIIPTVFITKVIVENVSKGTVNPPKNLIVVISDGMGQSYNTAYRLFKQLDETIIDKHFKGRYSTTPTNKFGITDSAAGAVCFASAVQTHNSFLGLDGNGNPQGSILAAAKRQGKGTGIVATKSVTDATPAAFSAHSLYRSWSEMISKQQAMRQINGVPMLDVLLGGGRRYFERWGFFQNQSMHEKYGWNTVTENSTKFLQELDHIDISEMPYMGLFSDQHYPYYLDRIHGDVQSNDTIDGITQYPGLLAMSKKAINLLNAKYEKEGFFLMVEASEVDWCGHRNDIVCLLWEMDEFMQTTEYILNWAEQDGETLVVMLSDHETGGLTVGRDMSMKSSEKVRYWDGTAPRDLNVSAAWASFDNAYGIAAPSDISSAVEHYGVYKWIPGAVENCSHTADWFAEETGSDGSITTVEELYVALETMFLGGENERLTQLEKDFVASAFERSSTTKRKAFAMLMNARTLTGWTTHGHTAADCAVHAFGPKEDEFIGHWKNYEIGLLLSELFDVEREQMEETEYLQQLFVDGILKICDPHVKPGYIEWNHSVSYPEGNLLYPDGLCVEQWL